MLLVGVPLSLVAGVAMFVAAFAVLSTGDPWSGLNYSVVAGAWAVATVLLLVLDRHARALRGPAVERHPPAADLTASTPPGGAPPGGASERGISAAGEPDDQH